MGKINPCAQEQAWKVCSSTVIADSYKYYTKREIDKIITGEMPIEEIQEMVDEAVSGITEDFATKEALNELSEQVSANTQAILNTYTKEEVYNKQETNTLLDAYLTKLRANEMFANYTKVENTTLVLNADNIS